MDSKVQVLQLIRYKAWANKLVFNAVLNVLQNWSECSEPDSLKRLSKALDRIQKVDAAFCSYLLPEKKSERIRDSEIHCSIPLLFRLQLEIDAWYYRYFATLSFEEICSAILLKRREQPTVKISPREILVHVVNHNTSQRALVTQLLFQVFTLRVRDDFMVFLEDNSGWAEDERFVALSR